MLAVRRVSTQDHNNLKGVLATSFPGITIWYQHTMVAMPTQKMCEEFSKHRAEELPVDTK